MQASEAKHRALARRRLEERAAERDLLRFVPLYSPEYAAPTALAPICDVFDRIQRGERVFACIEAPPRHGKSETLFHGCARLLKHRPKTRIAYVTYSQDVADDQSRLARDRALAAGVQFQQPVRRAGSKWDPSASVRHWQTAAGGGFLATSRDGGLVSKGFDLIIFDDPIKNREEAESQTVRDKVWESLRGDIFTRLEPGGSVLLNHQRWNDDDPIARVRAARESNPDYPPFEDVTLPAIDEEGRPLWGKRYDLRALAMIRATVGEYNWWSQYMQRPRPKGGRVFGEFTRYEPPALLIRRHIVIACDPAGTAKTSADNTAIVVLATWRAEWTSPEGIVLPSMLYADVLRCYSFKLEIPDTVAFLDVLQRHWPGAPIPVETQGGQGQGVVQSLRRINPNLRLVEVPARVDKFQRAQGAAAGSKQGRLRTPLRHDPSVDSPEIEKWLREHEVWDEGQWIAPYHREVERFTGVGDAVDDRVDATAHGWNFAEGFAGEAPKPEGLKERTMASTGGF